MLYLYNIGKKILIKARGGKIEGQEQQMKRKRR